MALSDLVSSATCCFPMNETSGNITDSVNSHVLTAIASPGTTTGKLGNARTMDGSTQVFRDTTDSTDYGVDDWSSGISGTFGWRVWVRFDTVSVKQYLICKGRAEDSESARAVLYLDSDSKVKLTVPTYGGTAITITASTFGTLSTATWYLIHAWHTVSGASNGTVGIAVNGTIDTATTTYPHSTPQRNTRPFSLGALVNAAGDYNSHGLDGDLDEVVILHGEDFTSAEVSEDYNSGTGVAFADWSGGGGGGGSRLFSGLLGVGI